MKKGTVVLSTVLLLATTTLGSDQIPGKKQGRPIAIVGAMIHPVSSTPIISGTIVFDNGKITALGTQVQIPPDAEVIDGGGKHVYPGLIGGETQLGLTEISAVRATRDMNETGKINPNVRADRAFNPESELIPVARANGITLVVSTPVGGVISGMSAAMMMDGWTYEDMTLKAPVALNVSWPRMTLNRAPWITQSEEDQKKERDKNLQSLKDAFRDARAYMEAKKAEGQRGIPYHNVDMRWESMIPVFEGKIPVVIWAYEIQQIQAAVAFAEQEKLKIIIGGGYDAARAADLLKSRNIPVLIVGTHRLPSQRSDMYDDPFSLPNQLYKAGVEFAIVSGEEPGHERSLPYVAATAAAYGLPKEEALKAITLSPAQILGFDDRVGSLEPGKDATLIVTSGDPLEIMTNVEMEFIQGRRVDLSSRHTILNEKYQEKYKRMKH